LDYDDGMSKEELSQFVIKATRQQVIQNRNDVENMTVSLASLFKSDVLEQYMDETQKVLDQMDSPEVFSGPTRKQNKVDLSEKQRERRVQESMQKLMPLTQVMQGTWKAPE